MPVQRRGREFAKRLLSLSRVKIVYAKITRTRITLLYLYITLFSCLVLCGLQGLLLYDNTTAVGVLRPVIVAANVPPHITMREEGDIQVCDRIPEGHGSDCLKVKDILEVERSAPVVGNPLNRRSGELRRDHDDDDEEGEDDDDDDDGNRPVQPLRKPHAINKDGSAPGLSLNQQVAGPHSLSCIYSLSFLEEDLHDSQREDVATVFFHLWLFTIGLVAILNESLPHLGAAFFGHVLGGAWAASRIQSTRTLVSFYRTTIVPGPCRGVDLLGSWWELRLVHTVPVVVVNGVSIIALGLLSWKLLKVYNRETLSRVGASPVIHGMYKLVLCFSVGLQLASFFIVVSTAVWIAKIARGDFRAFARHSTLYLASFIVVSIVVWPWLILGWICVRRECRIRFAIFGVLSGLLITISSVMFSSNLYRCIFMTWQFFATVTVTAFVFLVLTTILGIFCYFNYGKGLKEYLQVTEALEGEDFTPVYFPRHDDHPSESKLVLNYTNDQKYDLEKTLTVARQAPMSYASLTVQRNNRRGSSIYSDNNDSPILMSSSPPLISDLGAPGESVKRRITKTVRKSRVASGRAGALSGWGAEDWSETASSGSENSASTTSSPVSSNEENKGRGIQVGTGRGVRDLVDLRRPPAAAMARSEYLSPRERDMVARIPSLKTVSAFRPQLPGMDGASSDEGHETPRRVRSGVDVPDLIVPVPTRLKERKSVRTSPTRPMPQGGLPAVPKRF